MKQIHAILAVSLVLTIGLFAYSALAEGTNEIFAVLPDAPEGIAVDSNGVMYATTINGQQVFRINDDGSSDLIATVPSEDEVGHGLLIGLEADADNNLIIAYTQHSEINGGDDLFDPHHPACRDTRVTRTGVYKVEPATGTVTAIATRGDGHPFCFPDDVDVDKAGNIYLTDLTYAGIWKISADGSSVALWSADPLLNWKEDALPLGVNVLVLDRAEENIFAATTTLEGLVVRIPINEDGTAGKAEVHSRGHTFFDGIEIDDEGYLYVAEPGLNTILAVSPEAGWMGMTARKTLTSGGALQGPTSLVLRDGVLYTTNLAFGVPPENQNKAIVAIRDFEKK
jgi:sugar lactone lactonase YvrE